jgi:hypothetical protein
VHKGQGRTCVSVHRTLYAFFLFSFFFLSKPNHLADDAVVGSPRSQAIDPVGCLTLRDGEDGPP